MPYNLKKQGIPMRRGDHLKDWREYNTGVSSIFVGINFCGLNNYHSLKICKFMDNKCFNTMKRAPIV